IDMKPDARLVRATDLGNVVERIERAGIHLASIGDDNGRAIEPAEGGAKLIQVDRAAGGGNLQNAGAANAQRAERPTGAGVDFGRRDHRDWRVASQAIESRIEAKLTADPLTRGSEADEIRHGRPAGNRAMPISR